MSTAVLTFSLLGPVGVRRDGVELDPGSPQQQALLAMLLLREGAQVSIDELVTGLWGEDPPRAAVGTVRTYVSRLRRVLDPSGETILPVAGGYTMPTGGFALDLVSFRELTRAAASTTDRGVAASSLRAALDLWRGTALAGLPGPYAEAQRTRLAELHTSAVEERVAVDLELGRLREVLADLSTLVEEHPLRERLREMQMLALHRAGRQADALAVFQQTRQVLITELGIEPGCDLQRLHQRILTGDPTLVPERTLVTARVPAELPAPLADFTGRRPQLRALAEAFEQTDAVPVLGLVGLPGAGKSSLAVRAAHGLGDRFPDGILHAELGGLTATPVDPGVLLGRWLRTFGIAEHAIPHSLPERTALWRSVQASRRLLLVLDDAHDVEQVRPLLPTTPGSAVLLTSVRRMVGLAGADWFTVDAFEPAEALAYLARRIGPGRVAAEPDVALRLAAGCSFLPLLLHLLASRLASRPRWSLADAERAQAAEAGSATLYDRLDRVFGTLEPTQAWAFHIASVPDEQVVTACQIGARLGVPARDADAVLGELADLHLLDADRPGRYHYHDVVRRYARQLAFRHRVQPPPRRGVPAAARRGLTAV